MASPETSKPATARHSEPAFHVVELLGGEDRTTVCRLQYSPVVDLPLLAARAELNRRGDPTVDWLDYIRNNAIDVPTVGRFAGVLAVTHCVLDDHRRFDFADPAEREAEPAAVIEALGEDGAT